MTGVQTCALPIFVQIKVKPTPSLIRLANVIKSTGGRMIQILTNLRELSDGFQYTKIETGKTIDCKNCTNGKQIIKIPKDSLEPTANITEESFTEEEVICQYCGGTTKIKELKRSFDVVNCPKDQVFIDKLDKNEEIGRFIVWGGFTATIDRLVDIAVKQGWYVLRVDGRGYCSFSPILNEEVEPDELLISMDLSHLRYNELLNKYRKICFVGHPQAGGEGLTLTSACEMLFFSNDFSGKARMQAIHRFHRVGMDSNRGATVLDRKSVV